jgi:urease gamma subunit
MPLRDQEFLALFRSRWWLAALRDPWNSQNLELQIPEATACIDVAITKEVVQGAAVSALIARMGSDLQKDLLLKIIKKSVRSLFLPRCRSTYEPLLLLQSLLTHYYYAPSSASTATKTTTALSRYSQKRNCRSCSGMMWFARLVVPTEPEH